MKKLGITLITCLIIMGLCLSAYAGPAKTVLLKPVDGSGIFALPAGAQVVNILINGQPAAYTLVKNGTEVDVWAARPGSKVEAILK